jgi:hypothetical protein
VGLLVIQPVDRVDQLLAVMAELAGVVLAEVAEVQARTVLTQEPVVLAVMDFV